MRNIYKCEIKKQNTREPVANVTVRATPMPFEEYIDGVVDRDVVKIEILYCSQDLFEVYTTLKQRQCCLVRGKSVRTIRQNSIILHNNVLIFNVDEELTNV